MTELKIAFIFALFYWLKPLTGKSGEKTGVLVKTPQDELQNIATTTNSNNYNKKDAYRLEQVTAKEH